MEVETLFPFQVEGARYLAAHDQAFLADEMGLGKTGQAVVACDLVSARRVLVVCPAAARPNWQREFERFSFVDRSVSYPHEGGPLDAGVVIVSYEYVSDPRNLKALIQHRFDVLILDEAHYVKSKNAVRTRAIYKYLVKAAARTWRLSGTPAPNDASELWPHLASAGVYAGRHDEFVSYFMDGYDDGHRRFKITGVKPARLAELRSLVGRFMLRRRVADVMTELPPVRYSTVVLEPSPVDERLFFTGEMLGRTQAEFHAVLKKRNDLLKAIMELRIHKGAPEASIGVLENLRDVETSTLRRYIGLTKVPAAAVLLDTFLRFSSEKAKVVVFAVHVDVIKELHRLLREWKPVTFYGGSSPAVKENSLAKFRDDPTCRVFIGHIKTAGTAIDGLQHSCHEVVILEASWTPAENAQAVMRIHRHPQTKPVRVRFFSVAGSIDEHITNTLKRKTEELTKLFD